MNAVFWLDVIGIWNIIPPFYIQLKCNLFIIKIIIQPSTYNLFTICVFYFIFFVALYKNDEKNTDGKWIESLALYD